MRLSVGVLVAALAAFAAVACGQTTPAGTLQVLETLPHDSTAYTQGLVFHEGMLYESTGRYGSSDVRRVEPATGRVLRRTPLPERFFGEGLARIDGRLVQLTWQEDTAFVWGLDSLDLERTLEVKTRGWGLCFDGSSLYSTSGGSILFRHDPETLAILDNVQITMDGAPLSEVNELECVGDHVYGNVYQRTLIVKIEKATGRVVAHWDASNLVPPAFRGSADAVLNGIAWDPGPDLFYLTGKLWPVMYRVRLAGP